jgi:glycerol kinase
MGKYMLALDQGLVLDACFSGTKITWILDDVDGVRAHAQ